MKSTKNEAEHEEASSTTSAALEAEIARLQKELGIFVDREEQWSRGVLAVIVGGPCGFVAGCILVGLLAFLKFMNPISALGILLATSVGGIALAYAKISRRTARSVSVQRALLRFLRSCRDGINGARDVLIDELDGLNEDFRRASTSPIALAPTTIPEEPMIAAAPDFAWIHLSDIHFGHGDAQNGWDQKLVVAALLDDLRTLEERGVPAPRAVLVTGDIAFSGGGRKPTSGGHNTEYNDAAEWLAKVAAVLGLPRTAIYLVPGNHDVDRKVDDDRNVQRLVEALRERHGPGRTLDDSLAHPSDRAQLSLRQEKYLNFAAGFAPVCKDIHWVATVPGANLTVRLVGLNTALLASGDDDRGKLRIGKEQLERSLAGAADDALVLVLAHHPMKGDWIAEERDVNAWIRRHAHVLLTGHVHDAESENSRSGLGRDFVHVAAGAVHGDSLEVSGHSYSVVAATLVDAGEVEIRVWPRRWADKSKSFRLDVDGVPEGKNFTIHKIRLRRA